MLMPRMTVRLGRVLRCSVEGSLEVQEKGEGSAGNLDEFTQKFREMRWGICIVRSQYVILNVWDHAVR